MAEKKAYSSPTIYRVRLDPEQAILAVCSAKAKKVKKTGRIRKYCSKKCKNYKKKKKNKDCNSAANS